MSQRVTTTRSSQPVHRAARGRRWAGAVAGLAALIVPALAGGAEARGSLSATPAGSHRFERVTAAGAATWTGFNAALGAAVTATVDGRLELAFAGDGDEPAVVGLGLTAVGGAGRTQAAPVLAAWPEGARIALDRGELRQELVNDGRGVLQVLQLPSGPLGWDGASALELGFELAEGTIAEALGERAVRLAVASAPGRALAELRVASLEAASGRQLSVRLEVASGVLRVRLDAENGDFPVTLKLLLETPTWVVWGGQADAQAGYAVATAGDVNDDGYSDVIVGIPEWDSGQSNEGRVRVYHGGPSGLSTTASWSWESNQAGANAGMSVATAGDVNGDGYSDVVVGAPYWNGAAGADQGAAFVFLGSASGLASSPQVTLTFAWAGGLFGFSVSSAGDVNGDGYSDVIVGAPEAYLGSGIDPNGGAFVFHGSAAGVDATADWSEPGFGGYLDNLGYRVALAGDVDGDGYSDVLVGSPEASQPGCGFLGNTWCDWGRVAGWLGSPGGLDAGFLNTAEAWAPSWDGPYIYCEFGQSLATLGDLDGDGYSDFAYGSPGGHEYSCRDTEGNAAAGQIRIWRGSSSGASPLLDLVGVDPDSVGRGASLFTAGDVNGDGLADLVFGEHDPAGLDAVGRVVVRLATPSGYDGEVVVDPGYQSTGWAVSLAGDVNGDGYSDLIGGAPYANGAAGGDEGAAFVWYGRDTGAAAGTATLWLQGPAPSYELGRSVAFVEANHDGIDDLLVGAPGGSVDHGIVYLHLGRAGQLPEPSPSQQYTSPGDGRREGTAVAGGDLNGDGYEDIVTGAPGAGVGGELRIYCGTAGGSPSTTSCATLTGAAGDQLGASIVVLGDVNGDGIADLAAGAPGHRVSAIELGAAYLWLGSTDGVEGAPDATYLGTQAGADFGMVVARAGDVNRDGLNDLAVAAPYHDSGGLVNAGGVWVYHGRQASPPDTIADRQLLGGSDLALFGYGLAGAGDVNGDGFADLVVGQPYRDVGAENAGRALLYPGSAAGISGTASWWVDGTTADEHLGWTVAGGGDVNGDGFADFLAASPDADTSIGGVDHPLAGKARLFLGGAAGPSETASPVPGSHDGGRLGRAAAMAGDVNGDGLADLALGSPVFNAEMGGAIVRSPRLGPPLKPRQSNADASLIPYQGASAAANQFRVGLGTRTIFGRGYERLQVEVEPLGTAFDGAGLLQGTGWSASTVASLFYTVSGLTESTPYHWRSRQVYQKAALPLQPHGPWRSRPLGSWAEADLRTRPATAPDLRVSIATNAPQVNLGSQYLATTTVTALSGGFAAEDVELYLWGSFMGLTDLTVTAGVYGSCSPVGSDWLCSFTDPIPSGSSRTVLAWGDTNALGEVTIFAQASSSNGDLDLGNNYDSETTPVVIGAGLELTVNSTGNGGDVAAGNGVCETSTGNGVCTLRAAVQEANALAGPNTITIATAGTITVSGGIAITDDATIRSGLSGHAEISGGATSQIFSIASALYPDVVLERLELIAATSAQAGSAVFLSSAGDVTLTDCRISGSSSSGGGAVGVGTWAGNLLFDGCAFNDNTSSASGAAVAVYGNPIYQRGVLEIRGSTFNSNHSGASSEGGGAIAVLTTDWDLVVTDTSFLYNSDPVDGGGAMLLSGSSLDPITAQIERASFVGNSADGGAGGAILSNGAELDLVNCTFAENSASYGGAVSASNGSLALSQTTITGNTTASSGGGIWAGGSIVLVAAATIFAGNSPTNCAGVTTLSGDHNLSSDSSCVFAGSANLVSTPALLGAPVGGPGGLIYFPPAPGSPALDSAGAGLCLDAFFDNVDDDMLSNPRPTDGTGDGLALCDRGAVEIEIVSEPPFFADGFESGNLTAWSAHVP